MKKQRSNWQMILMLFIIPAIVSVIVTAICFKINNTRNNTSVDNTKQETVKDLSSTLFSKFSKHGIDTFRLKNSHYDVDYKHPTKQYNTFQNIISKYGTKIFILEYPNEMLFNGLQAFENASDVVNFMNAVDGNDDFILFESETFFTSEDGIFYINYRIMLTQDKIRLGLEREYYFEEYPADKPFDSGSNLHSSYHVRNNGKLYVFTTKTKAN